MRIGIDVSGTNTDAVLLEGSTVVAAVKSSTTPEVTSGIVASLRGLHNANPFDRASVKGVMIGTTYFINAIVEAKRLAPTGAIRSASPWAATSFCSSGCGGWKANR
jgi:N-methylhydantoinase A/oxoprolinase/acetone carboxylase beta subunit